MFEVSKFAIPLVAGFLLCGNASAQNILYVSPKGKVRNNVAYTTIQAAVNAAQPGDGIHVESATYTEEVSVINKGSLLIHGVGVANNGPPTLNGSIRCTATKPSVLGGFTIHPQVGNSGIYFNNAPGSYASGTTITGCSVDAIDIYNFSNCIVISNEIDNSSYAIGIRNSEYLVITNNHGSGVQQVFEYSMPDATDTVTNNNFTP